MSYGARLFHIGVQLLDFVCIEFVDHAALEL